MSSHIALPQRCVQTYQHKNNDQRCEIKVGARGRVDWLRQYIEALLVDEEQANQVWEAWDKGEIDDFGASGAWLIVALSSVIDEMQ